MATLTRAILRFQRTVVEELCDLRTKDWFLAGSPWPILAILTAYYFFIFKWGPAFMKNRKPFKLDRVMQAYNLAQVILCSYLVYEGIKNCYGPYGTYNWFCEPVDYSNDPAAVHIARRVHFYFLLKVADLLDTVFFILRKKQSQVTFLHVYHHMGMVVFGWLGTNFFPGGHGVFLGLINSFVHSVMYTYYFVSSLNPEYSRNIWWKKHITQLQIIQFLMLFLHYASLVLSKPCGFPKWTAFFLLPQNFFFLILFLDFYKKTYLRPAKPVENGNKTT